MVKRYRLSIYVGDIHGRPRHACSMCLPACVRRAKTYTSEPDINTSTAAAWQSPAYFGVSGWQSIRPGGFWPNMQLNVMAHNYMQGCLTEDSAVTIRFLHKESSYTPHDVPDKQTTEHFQCLVAALCLHLIEFAL